MCSALIEAGADPACIDTRPDRSGDRGVCTHARAGIVDSASQSRCAYVLQAPGSAFTYFLASCGTFTGSPEELRGFIDLSMTMLDALPNGFVRSRAHIVHRCAHEQLRAS